jgi:hypothetical protein
MSAQKISPLRQRFLADMNLAGLSSKTQQNYICVILDLVRYCGNIPPERMTEKQIEDYLIHLQSRYAHGTFVSRLGAIRSLFCNTLNRDWALLTKKKFDVPCDSAFPLPSPIKTVNVFLMPSNIPSTALVQR